MVVLGSSNGAIEVEAVGLDKFRVKLSKLYSLRYASLETEYVASVEPAQEIANICPSVYSSRDFLVTKTVIS